MERLEFRVKGSRGDEYKLVFQKIDNNMNAFCNCQAGDNGLYCKHRFALMDGDVTNLLSSNANDVKRLRDLMAGTRLEVTYRQYFEANRLYEIAKRNLDAAKKELARAMYR